MDFSDAPHLIEGRYRYLLHVRDLASQCHLAALPVLQPTAASVIGLLRALCAHVDPPLVLKVDNGAPFISHDLRGWAGTVGTQLLYSPPCCPRYNGAIEASIASITTRAHHAAVATGQPEAAWTCDHVEAARAGCQCHHARVGSYRPTRHGNGRRASPSSSDSASRGRARARCVVGSISHRVCNSASRLWIHCADSGTFQSHGGRI